LLTRGDTIMYTTFPHQMRFYTEKGAPWVQSKHYNKDVWDSTEENLWLWFLPTKNEQSNLIKLFGANDMELKALGEFITY